MKYEFAKRHRKEYSLKKILKVLGASRSGYYVWLKRKESERSRSESSLLLKIIEIYELSKGSYGSPRITAELLKRGIKVSRQRVSRIMRKNAIKSKIVKKYKVTTNSKHNESISPNLLSGNFRVSEPNKVWVSDITYIWTLEGWLYLTVIMDLFNREILGSSKSKSLSTGSTVIKAFEEACKRRKPSSGLIFHSDRGIQYCSKDFRKRLLKYDINQSMSGKGNCYDNAVSESFFHTLKVELIKGRKFFSRAEASEAIFEYIEIFYNRVRLHSTLDYMSPTEYLNNYKKGLLKVA